MPVQIQIEDNITLAQLIKHQQDGYMVEQTPHVGNIAMRTLALISLGIKCNLVDTTIGEKDNLFYPHCLIMNGTNTPIAPASIMTTHNKLTDDEMTVTEFHTQPLKQKGLEFYLHSDWLSERKDLANKIIETVMDDFSMSIWKRYVDEKGTVSNRQAFSKNEVLGKIHKINTAPNEGGWVIPNPINILIDLVIGSIESEKELVYMLSGQSMYKYIHKNYDLNGPMDEFISSMYDVLKNNNFAYLPKLLQVKMVPTPIIRHFIAPMKLKNLLDNKLRYYQKMRNGNSRCGIKMSKHLISKQHMLNLRNKREKIFCKLSKGLAHVYAESETGTFYSQHDLVKDQDTVYIPDQVMNMPLSEMTKTIHSLRNLAK